MPRPVVGREYNGFVYQGGDPNNSASWRPAPRSAGGGGARGGRGNTGPTTSGQTGLELRNAHDSAATAQREIGRVSGFQDLNAQQETGGIIRNIPGADWAEGVINPEISGMRAITARLAPEARVPGSGATSDRDINMFERGGPRVQNARQVNDRIIDDARIEAARRQARAEFLDRYAQEHGNLLGATEAWNQQWNITEPLTRAALDTAGVIRQGRTRSRHPPRPSGGSAPGARGMSDAQIDAALGLTPRAR